VSVLSATFEASTEHFSNWFSATVTSDAGDAHSGSKSLLVVMGDSFSGVELDNYPYLSGVTAGVSYDFTFWYKESVATMPTVTWSVIWYDSAVAAIRTDTVSLARATSWTKATTTLVAPAGTVTYGFRFTTSAGGAGPAYRIDDLTVDATPTGPTGDLAADGFTRTASSLGTADMGGPWSFATTGGATVATNGSAAEFTCPSSSTGTAQLPNVLALSADVLTQVWVSTGPSGNGAYLGPEARVTAAGRYRARLRIASGVMTLQLVRAVGLADNLLGSQATISGTYTSPAKLWIRLQVRESNPTTLQARCWFDGSTEPSTWQVTATDNTAGMQEPGSVGLWAYASSTSSTTVVDFDNVAANKIPYPRAGWGRT
jgi:hypothetical protein